MATNEKGFLGQAVSKQMSSEFAEKLWPMYQETGGNAAEVLRRAKLEGIEISKPTLDKLVKNFGFRKKLEQAQRVRFTASIDHTGELNSLLAEITKRKNEVQKGLEVSPEDYQLHRLYGDYIGKILEVRRQMIQAKQVDKDDLVLAALKAVIRFCVDSGESEAAEFIGASLEEITFKIKDGWKK